MNIIRRYTHDQQQYINIQYNIDTINSIEVNESILTKFAQY